VLKQDSQTMSTQLKETRESMQMLKETLRTEREKAKEDATRLVGQLNAAAGNGESEAAISKLKEELNTARGQMAKLTEELNKPQEIATVTVEKIPDEVAKELEELKRQAVQQINPSTIKFKFQFDSLVKNFNDLLAVLGEIDAATQPKYKAAIKGLLDKMAERL